MDSGPGFEKVRAAIKQLGPADHACTLYVRREEEVAIAVSYIRTGLERGELCVCVVDDGGKSILHALASEGVDVDAQLRERRLAVFEKPLAQNLKPRDMVGQIEQWAKDARDAGHSGFRIVGEMTWALDGGLKELAEFEARLNLNRVWERHGCAGLCQFDVRRFSPEMLREMIIVHPLVVVGDRVCRNPFYVPPEQYLSPDWPLHETDWMITNLEELQRMQDGLRASQERHQALSRQLVLLQEKERRELARELHDRVGQNLTALHINASLLGARLDAHDDPLMRARNQDSLQLIASTLETVRNVMYDLRPPMLDEFGLVASLRWHAKQFTERNAIPVDIRSDDGWRGDPEVEIALFRISQEALNNVVRHSQAKHVRIELLNDAEMTELIVEDDGIGVNPQRDPGERITYGLISMRERAEAVGGTLEMSSEQGRGTRIRAKVPRKA